jgi:hypothetical protein
MAREADRLHLLCDVSTRLATSTDLDEVLRHATCAVRELFDAEACAVALTDPPALHCAVAHEDGSEAPASAVVGCGRRPHRYVEDQLTTTRAALCVPVRSQRMQLGTVEVLDPRTHFTLDDRELLEALAAHIAAAYEMRLHAGCPGSQGFEPRTVGVFAGFGLLAVGGLLVLGTVFVHQALALSLSDLVGRPGLWPGLLLATAGAVLLGRCRRPAPAGIRIAAHRQGALEPLATVVTGGRAA